MIHRDRKKLGHELLYIIHKKLACIGGSFLDVEYEVTEVSPKIFILDDIFRESFSLAVASKWIVIWGDLILQNITVVIITMSDKCDKFVNIILWSLNSEYIACNK